MTTRAATGVGQARITHLRLEVDCKWEGQTSLRMTYDTLPLCTSFAASLFDHIESN